MAIFLARNPSSTLANWWNNSWHQRKKITITNSGAADTNKKVKIDVDTTGLVDPNTANFHQHSLTFTPAMAKRNAPGPFTSAPIIQGVPSGQFGISGDVISYSKSTAIKNYFYPTIDVYQGSIVLWVTPEWNGNDGLTHYLLNESQNESLLLYKTTGNNLVFLAGGVSVGTSVSSWTAGSTYSVVIRWDSRNTLDGTNYGSISVNDVHTFGKTTPPNVSNIDIIYFGLDRSNGREANAIIEGFTVYRRPLFDGTYGIDVGNGDEIAQIYNSGTGKDPTLVTGSWDVVFALPTNQTLGSIATGTGNAWTHPHASNLLYTSSTNTGGFMMNGTYTSDGWTDEGTPSSVSALATAEKIFSGGYKVTSDAANEGIYYSKSVTAGNDWVIRALGNSDGTCTPKVILYDQTNSAEIGSITGTTTSTRTDPDTYLFTGEAPSGMTELRVKLINTATTGTCYWHQVELLSNQINNPSYEGTSANPYIPTSWTNSGLDAGDSAYDTSDKNSGIGSFSYTADNPSCSWESMHQNLSSTSDKFYSGGMWYKRIETAATNNRIGPIYDTTNPTTYNIIGIPFTLTSTSWAHIKGVWRRPSNLSALLFHTGSQCTANFKADDAYHFQLSDVSLTLTPASLANSTESTGIRIDGRDTATQSAQLTTTQGTIKFNYTPRHSAADALKFLESTNVYLGEWYTDANNYIRAYWNAADSLTLSYNMNGGGEVTGTPWTSTGISAGTTYEIEITYTGGGNMTLSVDGDTKITHSSIPAAFDTAPTLVAWGHRGQGNNDRQADATFDHVTQTTGTFLKPDCSDIRFTDSSGKELDYFLDSANGACNSTSTDFWVTVPTINSGDTTIYMYYSNPSATAKTSSTQLTQDTFTPASVTLSSAEKNTAAAGYWAFNEGQGTTAHDSTSNANHATISGATWKTDSDCFNGNCLFFDGTDDVATIASNPTIALDSHLKDGFTIQAWVRVNSDGESDVGQIFNKGTNTYLRVTNQGSDGKADLEAKLDLTVTDATVSVTDGLTLNKWHHVALSYTDDADDEISLFIDGAKKATSSNGDGSPAPDSNPLLLGGPTSANFHGFIDEFKIYPYERSTTQIKTDLTKSSSSSQGISATFGQEDKTFLSNGLVGYWKMDDNVSGNAQAIIDHSGNRYDGTTNYGANATGMDCTQAGKFGTACNKDGTDDFISIAQNDVLGSGNELTISAWVNPTENRTQRIIGCTQSSTVTRWGMGLSSNGMLTASIRGGSVNLYPQTETSIITPNNWTFVTVTYSGSNGTAKLYVNGVYKAELTGGTGAIPLCDSTINIGKVYDDTAYFSGKIDEVRIYNRALSPSEVSQLYNWAPGPLVHWRMNEGTGSSAVNTGNGGSDYNLSLSMSTSYPISWTNGKFGKALSYGTRSVSATTLYTPELEYRDDKGLTFAAWIYAHPDESQGVIVSKPWNSSGDYNYSFYLLSDNTLRLSMKGNILVQISTTQTVSKGEWHHVGFTLIPETKGVKMYLDGVLIKDTTHNIDWSSVTDDNHKLALGCIFPYGGGFCQAGESLAFYGLIDEVKIYNYARTPAQIVEDMNAGHPAPGSPVGSAVGHWKFDEGHGDTAHNTGNIGSVLDGDLAGSSTTCPTTGSCPTWTNDGKFGKALFFDGASGSSRDDFLTVPSNSAINNLDDMTFSAWINPQSLGEGGFGRIFQKASSTFNGRGFYTYTNNSLSYYHGWSTSTNGFASWITPDDSLKLNQWSHVVITYNISTTANDPSIYINGVLQPLTEVSMPSGVSGNDSSGSLIIGNRNENDRTFDGYIDEVKIYNFILTAEQAKVEHNQGQSAVFGAGRDADGNVSHSAASEFCVPGDTATCNPPVAEYTFNEKTGTTANDTSDNNFTAAFTGTPAWQHAAQCRSGSCLEFNGTTDRLDYDGDLGITDYPFTLQTWAKTTSSSPTNGYIVSIGDKDTSDIFYGLYASNSSTDISLRANDGVSQHGMTYAASFNSGQWFHIVAVFNSATDRRLYVNGILRETGATSVTYNPAVDGIRIGQLRRNAPPQNPFTGHIDDVRLYDYARTPAQIIWDYNQGAPLVHYKLDECSGVTLNDASGTLNATLTIGGSGTQNSPGNCNSATGTEAWNNGTNGKFNSSLSFDGSDDYVSTANTALLRAHSSPYTHLSFGGWFNPAATPVSKTLLHKNNEFRLTTNASGYPQCELYSSSWQTPASGPTALPASTWTHLLCTYDGTTLTLYQNGLPISAIPHSITITSLSTTALSLGRDSGGNGYFAGLLDELKVWNYPLTPLQIKTDINQGAVSFRE